MSCSRCGGWLHLELGSNFGVHISAEDRVICVMCGRYRYVAERHDPKGRPDALPYSAVTEVLNRK